MVQLSLLRRLVLTLLTVMSLGLPFSVQAAPRQPEPFLPPHQLQRLSQAHSVSLTAIGWMRRTPRRVDDDLWQKSSTPVTPLDVAQIVALLGQTTALPRAPNEAQCAYAPGYQVTFLDAHQTVLASVLLCFNCDVVAVGDQRPRHGVVADLDAAPVSPASAAPQRAVLRYGQAQAQRAQLLAWVAKYFPQPLEQFWPK